MFRVFMVSLFLIYASQAVGYDQTTSSFTPKTFVQKEISHTVSDKFPFKSHYEDKSNSKIGNPVLVFLMLLLVCFFGLSALAKYRSKE